MGIENLFTVFILPTITLFGGLFIGRRNKKAEAQKTEMEAINEAIKIWQSTTARLEADYEILSKKYEALNLKYDILERKYDELDRQYKLKEAENKKLKNSYEKESNKKTT